MKDKVIRLSNNLQYYVLDELEKGNKKYLFAMQVDNDQDIATENYVICYYLKNNLNSDDIELYDIEDKKEYEEISNEFLKIISE